MRTTRRSASLLILRTYPRLSSLLIAMDSVLTLIRRSAATSLIGRGCFLPIATSVCISDTDRSEPVFSSLIAISSDFCTSRKIFKN